MFSGSITALITPMDEHGSIDYNGLKKLVEYHVEAGTDAIVAVGTTGESATVTVEEHVNIVLKTLEFSDGRIPVIAGAGANATHEAVAFAKMFTDTGVAGCLSVTPYYNKPTQEGLFQHFKAISESTDLPQILYNVLAVLLLTCCQRRLPVWQSLTISLVLRMQPVMCPVLEKHVNFVATSSSN